MISVFITSYFFIVNFSFYLLQQDALIRFRFIPVAAADAPAAALPPATFAAAAPMAA